MPTTMTSTLPDGTKFESGSPVINVDSPYSHAKQKNPAKRRPLFRIFMYIIARHII